MTDDRFLVADYARVYLFDRQTGELSYFKVDMGTVKSEFVPTAIAVDASGTRAYIANYTANNVLIVDIDFEDRVLRVIGAIEDKTISPEGIALSGSKLAVANYGGSNVQIFTETSGEWRLSCAIAVPAAHGVAFVGRFVYATSLGDKRLLKIDPETCAVIGSTGKAGWSDGEFLWPTAVTRWSECFVAVSDAHTGRISVFDADALQLVWAFGGNGPGLRGLNMPYGLAVTSTNVLVASTFGQRLVAFDKRSLAVTAVWSREPVWQWTKEDLSAAFLNSAEWEGKVNIKSKVSIGGKYYHLAFAELPSCDGGEPFRLTNSLNNSYYYFIQSIPGERGVFLLSPQNPSVVYVRHSDPEKRTLLPIGLDRWVHKGRVIGPQGVEDLASREPAGE